MGSAALGHSWVSFPAWPGGIWLYRSYVVQKGSHLLQRCQAPVHHQRPGQCFGTFIADLIFCQAVQKKKARVCHGRKRLSQPLCVCKQRAASGWFVVQPRLHHLQVCSAGVELQGQVGGFLNFTLINEVNKGAAQITAQGALCTATDTGGEMGNWRHICWGQHISRHQLV